MPYSAIDDLPPDVRDKLSEAEQRQWLEVFNDVLAETGSESAAFAAAWGAVNKARLTRVSVKAVQGEAGEEYHVEGWGLLFTGDDDPDLDKEFFTRATETLLEYYPGGPLWYEHREDPAYGEDPIGKRTDLKVHRRGLWVEHALDADHPHLKRTVEEIEAGELAYSSDTAAQLMERVRRGEAVEITRWPIIGWSVTKRPAEPALGPVSLKTFSQAVKAFAGAEAHQEDDNMKLNTQLLAALAGTFGVDANVEAVAAKVNQVKAALDGEKPEKAAVDLAALAAALGLPPEASREDLTTALEALMEALYAESEGAVEGEPGMAEAGAQEGEAAPAEDADEDEVKAPPITINYGKLSAAAKAARSLVPRDTIPGYHGKASRRSFQTGRERPLGLADLVVAHVNRDARALQAAQKAVTKGYSEKAVSYTSGPAGAYQLEDIIAEEIIEPLYATEVVMAAGATVRRFPGAETITFQKLNAGSTAFWGGPGAVVGQGQPSWGYVQINPKELVAEVLIHNKTLRNATAGLEQQIRNDVIKAIRLAMDYAFLLGVGGVPEGTGHSGAQPLGLYNIPNMTKTSLGTNGAEPKFSDLVAMLGRIEDANVELGESTGWIMAPRTKRSFTNKTDTQGRPLLRDDWAGGEKPTLLDHPYYTTTQVPVNITVGTSNDCSYIFAGVWENFCVGISLDVEIVIDESVYRRQRQTLLQAVTYVDCGVFYPEAFQIDYGVRP